VPAIVPAIESESLYAFRNGVKYIPRFSAANYKLTFAALRFAASLKLVHERASVLYRRDPLPSAEFLLNKR
jgi:hypothetical protein